MKVLLDESVPRILGFELPGHFVRTVQAMGWAGLSNGHLLAAMAEISFEVLITCDQNIEYQQNSALPVGLIILIAPDNRVPTILGLASAIREQLGAIRVGQIVKVRV